MRDRFEGLPLIVRRKSDGTEVTDLDEMLSARIVGSYQLRGIRVVSEEGGTAQYGETNVVVIDPVDGTQDSIEGQRRNPRRSLAMISIGMLTSRGLEMGAVCAPLLNLKEPAVLYGGGPDSGAFRQIGKKREWLRADQAITRGIVLVSTKQTPANLALNRRLEREGFTPLALHGAVFKACAVIDRTILDRITLPGITIPKLPVVGFITTGFLHDLAGTVPILRGAGAIVTSRAGDEIDFGEGTGSVMATTPAIHQTLLELVNT